jgi:pyruvate dehydrogenase E2 component (dihydrolipoamide acetyltransferase)
MEEGVVAKWLVNIGDEVKEGDILAEIETDKATMEFESFYEGTLLHIGINEGQTAAVDTLLAIVGEKDEDISSLLINDDKIIGQLDLVDQIKETEESADPVDNNVELSSGSNNFQVIKMPRLSDTMEEGTVSSWLVNIGDEVKEGDILAEIETDKATMEFESFYEGTLLYIGINEGQTALVDSLLAIIGDKNADFKSAIENFDKEDEIEISKDEDTVELEESSKNLTTEIEDEIISNQRILASPLAKKIAKEKNIDLKSINGTGDNGRITKTDIENHVPTLNDPPQKAVTKKNI